MHILVNEENKGTCEVEAYITFNESNSMKSSVNCRHNNIASKKYPSTQKISAQNWGREGGGSIKKKKKI